MIPQFCPENYHGNWLLVAADEWRKMLDAWAWFCFQMPVFFIVHTPDMGLGILFFKYSKYPLISCMLCFYSLGIQAAKTVKTCKLSEFLHGFLEIITEDQFRQLQRLHYPSLYAMKYNPTVNSRSQKMYYFILFGPLALCNASKDVTTSFYCFDVMGDLLLWEARFSQREECNHQNDGGLTRFRSADYFAVSDGRPSSNDGDQLYRFGIEDMYALRRTIFQSNHQSKLDLFVKVILHDCNVVLV